MENSTRALKISIIVQWILIAAAVGFGLYEERRLPEVLRSYIIEQDSKPLSQGEMIVMGSCLLLITGLIISRYISLKIVGKNPLCCLFGSCCFFISIPRADC